MSTTLRQSRDTIVAVSTPAGRSRRAIVRLSGSLAVPILRRITSPRDAQRIPRANYRSFGVALHLRHTRLPARIYLMRAPASYTREDIVEIHTFGNPPLLGALLEELTRRGARPAEPGEFTRRAFLNGRLDLTQAEAVQSLIHARSEAEYRAAAAALSGHLSRSVRNLRDRLADLAAIVEVSLDFSDQDVAIISYREVLARLRPVCADLRRLLTGAGNGKVLSHAVRAVLFGPPNGGKSSLFNAILRTSRAIVSPHPGTTRDTIEATIPLGGVSVELVDTAGLRPPPDEIEAIAVSRSRDALRTAHLALCVLDAASAPDSRTREALGTLEPGRSWILLNKSDLGPCHPQLRKTLPESIRTLVVSALTGHGIEHLLQGIRHGIEHGRLERAPSTLMVNARQSRILQSALDALERLTSCEKDAHPMDLVAEDIRQALVALSDITGHTMIEDILDRIFSNFCIGK